MLVPADGVDVLPHQVHHRGQGEDGDEPKKMVNLVYIRDSSPDSEAEEEGPAKKATKSKKKATKSKKSNKKQKKNNKKQKKQQQKAKMVNLEYL